MEQRTNIEALQQRLPFYKIRKEKGRHKQLNWQEEWDRFDARKTFETIQVTLSLFSSEFQPAFLLSRTPLFCYLSPTKGHTYLGKSK